jgi:hypothetical protein
MNARPARQIVTALIVTGSTALGLHARSYSIDGANCLFQLAKAAVREERAIRFSLLPLTERISRPIHRSAPAPVAVEEVQAEQEPASPQFTAAYTLPAAPAVEPSEEWPLYAALRPWQENPKVPGLSHTFTNPQAYMALDYSDIFETGRAPYKGGHGISVLFRRDF